MRVALFLDGKNFYEGMRGFDPLLDVDYERFGEWIARAVGGERGEFVGAHYYTGLSRDPAVGPTERWRAIADFLDQLAMIRGYFVHREPRVLRMTVCKVCNAAYEYHTEKRVDTRLVADLIHYAAVNAFDAAVVASGDEDFVPAVEAVDSLGKRVYLAVWPGQGVSRELRFRVYGQLDLAKGIADFGRQRRPPVMAPDRIEAPAATALAKPVAVAPPAEPVPASPDGAPAVEPAATTAAFAQPALRVGGDDLTGLDQAVIRELQNAESQLPYVSRWYFVNRWRGEGLLPDDLGDREAAIERLIERGYAEELTLTDAKGRLQRTIKLRIAEGR